GPPGSCGLVAGASLFFQAEDAIRGFHVTGVQTCALPISHACAGATGGYHGKQACVRGQTHGVASAGLSSTRKKVSPSRTMPRSLDRKSGVEGKGGDAGPRWLAGASAPANAASIVANTSVW